MIEICPEIEFCMNMQFIDFSEGEDQSEIQYYGKYLLTEEFSDLLGID
jgi:hypothetical protein